MEIRGEFFNQNNYIVVNEFLSSLRKENKKKTTIYLHRTRLQFFFKDRKGEFTEITQDDIQKWLEKLQGDLKERTLQEFVAILRAFYKFCVLMKYVKKSPVMEKKKRAPEKAYWVLKKSLPNEINQTVVNEYLEGMKDSGRTEKRIKTHRSMLQRFFIACKKPYPSITANDIEQWIDKYRDKWSINYISGYYSVIRSFFSFCEEKDYIENMPIKKTRWVGVAEKYWEIQQPIVNHENWEVLNEYLLYLKDEGYSKKTIEDTRIMLQLFFRRRKERFSSITTEEIYLWIEETLKGIRKETSGTYVGFIRSFYRFCVWKGYMERSPVIYKSEWEKGGEKYWVLTKTLVNARNHEVINEFLLSMKVSHFSEGTIRKYCAFLGNFFYERKGDFDSLTSDCILTWLIQHQKEWKEGTVCNYLSMLNSFYYFCVNEEYMEKSPIKMRWFPRIPKSIPKFLEKGEVAKILLESESGEIRNRAIVEFLLATGCRVGEVHRLDKAHIDFENRTAIVTGKGKKIRTVHFTGKCSMILERYLATRKDNQPGLFVSKWGARLGISAIQKIVRRLGESAKISRPLYPHRFRHTFATDLLSKGANLSFIADELGHKDIKVTQIYANLPKQEILTMYRKYMG
ncbi:hypothetical protein CSE16_12765 [Solibacillus sp. R5-41]|uniref:tyrosine-type recombinase/integrase n=1 Tax=Solibacillus sp. R5-41 TaxID=2048654 RepID=UPI000C124E28|nr:tyrosine-type recombinase/integrase [Solibacillus sp. R5-41]ATP40846.1 hypothetical protein CSE16_12765 [Solibacillus sp. R5-41]